MKRKIFAGIMIGVLLGAQSLMAEDFEFKPGSSDDSGDLTNSTEESKDLSEDIEKDGAEKEEVEEQKPAALEEDERFLKSIQSELDLARQEYIQVDENIQEVQEKIKEISAETISLKRQLSLLTQHMKQTELMIQNVQKQISKKEGEEAKLMTEIKVKEIEMQDLQRTLSEYLQFIYIQRNEYSGFDSDEYDRAIKILFSEDSIGEVLEANMYQAFLEDKGNDLMKDFLAAKGVLQVKQRELKERKFVLQKLRLQLKTDQSRYESQKSAKEQLLIESKGKERIFAQLVEQSKQQQNEIIAEITELQTNVAKVQDNMNKYGDYFDVKDYREMVDKKVEGIFSDDDEVNFRWPVSPSLGISAYYKDPSYVGVFGVQHSAIDIPVAQSTPVRAAEDAVVYKAKDNGMGYSYIVLAHKGGYMTLYGHISKINVEPGENVHKGQIIGLSGGAPGTKGAGYMTTGAHLHLEMFKGGAHIDPLSRLPLSYLPLSSVPEKYLPYVNR